MLGNTKQLLDDRVHQMMAEDGEHGAAATNKKQKVTFAAKTLTGSQNTHSVLSSHYLGE